jgi:hypothetical protein
MVRILEYSSAGFLEDWNTGILGETGILPIYLVPERKLGFFVKIKKDENFNHRHTWSISRIEI